MANVSYRAEDLRTAVIGIGYVGENERTQVRIDCGSIFAEYPAAVAGMTIVPPAGAAYPKAVTRDGDVVVWDVTDSDLASEGNGEMQLTFTKGTVVVKSCIARISIDRSIVGSGTVPDPVQDWIDDATEKLAAVEEAVQEAEDAADEIDNMTVAASGSEYGTNPTATITEVEGHKHVAFTIPAGQPGTPGDPTQLIDDTAGEGDTDKTWSADKLHGELADVKTDITELQITPVEKYGANGDGLTDDTTAFQNAINAESNIYLQSGKTYYIGGTVIIRKDCHIYGGEGATIKKNKTLQNNDNCIGVYGTLKKTTTLTSNYYKTGTSDNSGNRFTLSDMEDINIGDILVIKATDQYYSYARQYYYLGATLLISDIYDGHIYTSNSMPFNITNTENVSVKVYSAPTVIIENINFVSDISNKERWYYSYLIDLAHCKNTIIRNCNFTEFDMGISVNNCVNTLIDNITMSKSKYDNSIDSDGYGIEIISSTDTIINRLFTICAQNGVDLSGEIPNINTYIYNSNICAECRGAGVGLHENNYNLVVEDSVLGGLSLYGTAKINRCRIIKNNRPGLDVSSISIYGSHDPERSKYIITNCEIDDTNPIYISCSITQTPVQSFDNIVGSIEIINCNGGMLMFSPTADAAITSNVINNLRIEKWTNCYEMYLTENNIIKCCVVKDSTFTSKYWINKHTDAFFTNYIKYLLVDDNNRQNKKLYINFDHGDVFYLPEGVKVNLSATDQATHYTVCGENIASNKASDFSVGAVSGTAGNALTRTVNNNFSSSISVNENNEIVFTQPNNTTKVDIYHKCFVFAPAGTTVRMSCKLKNTGGTSGAGFRSYLAVVNAKTRLVTYKNNGESATATENGVTVTHVYNITSDSYVLVYLYCHSPVANSETTLSNFVAKVMPFDFLEVPMKYIQYEGDSIDGDGSILSVSGKNNIMSSKINGVSVSFKADLLC